MYLQNTIGFLSGHGVRTDILEGGKAKKWMGGFSKVLRKMVVRVVWGFGVFG